MKLVTRREWGARNPKAVNAPGRIDALVYHYSAADADEQSNHANCAARVRGIQRYHMDTQGWNDIAYNYLFCKHGYVFEGRGWNTRSGATGNDNWHTMAACFLGDDSVGRDDVTAAGRKAAVELAQTFVRVFPYGRKFKGHRDYMSTSCPGNELYGFVTSEAFRKLVFTPVEQVAWPIPLPKWYWEWAAWNLKGRVGPRPAKAPLIIPKWAWVRLKKQRGN